MSFGPCNPHPNLDCYYNAWSEILKSGSISLLFFFFQAVLSNLGDLYFHVNSRISLIISTKKKKILLGFSLVFRLI